MLCTTTLCSSFSVGAFAVSCTYEFIPCMCLLNPSSGLIYHTSLEWILDYSHVLSILLLSRLIPQLAHYTSTKPPSPRSSASPRATSSPSSHCRTTAGGRPRWWARAGGAGWCRATTCRTADADVDSSCIGAWRWVVDVASSECLGTCEYLVGCSNVQLFLANAMKCRSSKSDMCHCHQLVSPARMI